MVSRSLVQQAAGPRSAIRPIRVAHVIQNLNFGGMERVLHGLARELHGRGFDVHIVVLEYLGYFATGLESFATLHQVPKMSKFSLLYPRELASVLRGIAPDIVHTHSGVWLKGVRAARLAGVPAVVHTDHGRPDPVPWIDRAIDNLASRQTDVILAVSGALGAVLCGQVVHDPARVRVVTNGVDTKRLRPTLDQVALRRALDLPLNTLTIGTIGRLEPIKNYRLALRAFSRIEIVAGGAPPPLLVFVGDGSERGELEALAAELGLANQVRFLGWRTDAERIYGAFDLFTLTSLSEGTSISLLEAMSAGVCPIVTDVGGNRAVLGLDLASLLVAADDEVGLAEAWQRYLGDFELRAAIGARARARVEQAFSMEGMIDQHTILYRELARQDGDPKHEPTSHSNSSAEPSAHFPSRQPTGRFGVGTDNPAR